MNDEMSFKGNLVTIFLDKLQPKMFMIMCCNLIPASNSTLINELKFEIGKEVAAQNHRSTILSGSGMDYFINKLCKISLVALKVCLFDINKK